MKILCYLLKFLLFFKQKINCLAALGLNCSMQDLLCGMLASLVVVMGSGASRIVLLCGFSYPKVFGVLVAPKGIQPTSPGLEGRILTSGPLW